ncbi:tetratricopeptide repeat protein [Zavarzinia compransoris]|nr:tetratricopeptide repeat protein [Zavarzinia compransoris]
MPCPPARHALEIADPGAQAVFIAGLGRGQGLPGQFLGQDPGARQRHARADGLLLPEGRTVTVGPAAAPAAGQPGTEAGGIAVLMQRATFWRQRQRLDMAQSMLDQALAIDPSHPDALFQSGLIAVETGKRAEAEAYLARLAAAKPGDVRIERLKMAMDRGQISAAVIEQARQAARDGDNENAVKFYRQAFAGLPPPLEYALEYFMALAGTVEGWSEARTRLGDMLARSPADDGLKLSYARVLTYREASRREGIALLAAMAPTSPEADRSWGEALAWLDAARADEALYKAYLAAHPDDQAVAARWARAIKPLEPDTPDNAVQLGHIAVQAGKLDEARALFAKALELDPNHANAMAALASLLAHDGKTDEARALLERAFALDPALRTRAAGLYETTVFYGAYQRANAAFKAGRPGEAERLLRPLLDGRHQDRHLAVALMARAMAAQKKYAEAEKYFREALARSPKDQGLVDGLYGVLVDAGKTAAADALVPRISPALREGAGKRAAQAEAEAAKARAETLARAGDIDGALAAYRGAIGKSPDDPWLRLAYARLLRRQGQQQAAAETMGPPLARPAPMPAAFHAGALFALDAGRLIEAGTLLNAIPGPARTPEIVKLADDIGHRLQTAQARAAVAAGDRDRGLASLRALARRGDLTPAQWGEVASGLAEFGDTAGALAIARRELAKPPAASASLSDYAALIGLVGRHGTPAEGEALVARFRSKARTPEEIRQIAEMEAGQIAARADRLRTGGQIEPAFALLEPALGRSPDNPALLGALARIYVDAEMPDEAEALYDRLLAQSPEDEGVIMQLVWLAIGRQDFHKARRLLDPVLERGTADYQAHYADGLLLRQDGLNGAAIEAFERAQSLRQQELGGVPAGMNGAGSTQFPQPPAFPQPPVQNFQ